MIQDCRGNLSQPKFAKQKDVQHHPSQQDNYPAYNHVATAIKLFVNNKVDDVEFKNHITPKATKMTSNYNKSCDTLSEINQMVQKPIPSSHNF